MYLLLNIWHRQIILAFVCAALYLLILKPGYCLVAAVSAVNSATSAVSADKRLMATRPLPPLLVPYLLSPKSTGICMAPLLLSRGRNNKDGEGLGSSQIRKYK